MTRRSSRKAKRTPEDRLRDLQRRFKHIEDRQDLRQPYRFDDIRTRPATLVETFTTYGACDDPIPTPALPGER